MKNKRETSIFVAYDEFEPYDESQSEKFLLKAVLNSAISEVVRDGLKAKDAIRYFLDTDEEYLFSFRSICEHLNISPKQVLIISGLYDNPEFMNSYNRNLREKEILKKEY
ncbi:MAG: hypothetical protein KC414_07655 [Romboutsia sp.]|nr:hypothetical protein [Romboutsia sp.]